MWPARWSPMSLQIRRQCSSPAPFTQHHLGGWSQRKGRRPSESTVLGGALSSRAWLSRGLPGGYQAAWPAPRGGRSEARAVGGTPGAARPGAAAATGARVQLSPAPAPTPARTAEPRKRRDFLCPPRAGRRRLSLAVRAAGSAAPGGRQHQGGRARVSGAGARAGAVGWGSRPGRGDGGLDACVPGPAAVTGADARGTRLAGTCFLAPLCRLRFCRAPSLLKSDPPRGAVTRREETLLAVGSRPRLCHSRGGATGATLVPVPLGHSWIPRPCLCPTELAAKKLLSAGALPPRYISKQERKSQEPGLGFQLGIILN